MAKRRKDPDLSAWLAHAVEVSTAEVERETSSLRVVDVLARLDAETADAASFFSISRAQVRRRRREHPFWPLLRPRGT